MKQSPQIIILGSGMSAIACASNLSKDLDLKIYDKARGIGGRLCAKNDDGKIFHLGAQFCTAKTNDFQKFLSSNGVQLFQGDISDVSSGLTISPKDYFVHSEGMHCLLTKSSSLLNIAFQEQAIEVRISDKKIVFASGAEIAFDVLISSLPLPQAQQLLGMPITNDLAFYPCLAVGLVLDQALKTNFTAFKNVDSQIAWASSSRTYNSEREETWVVHFSPTASIESRDQLDEWLVKTALLALNSATSSSASMKSFKVFRWRYAMCDKNLNAEPFHEVSKDIFTIGDWHISPRVESAFTSGLSLAKHLNSKFNA